MSTNNNNNNINNSINLHEMSLQQLIKLIADKDAALQEKDDIIEHQNAVFHAALQDKDAAIQEKDAALQEIQEKDERIKKQRDEIYEGSIEKMIKDFDGIPDMPRVKELHPHQDRNRVASFSVDGKFITPDDLNFTINYKNKLTGSTLKSFLSYQRLIEKDGRKILSYENEATVADYVQGVVKMCLHSLGYFNCCDLYKEMRLFSLRPDLILVVHPERGIILIIEVKMPGDELFQSEYIAGQVSDYLLVQYRLGNSMPFVLLSSYREACLCRLNPASLHPTEDEEAGDGSDNTSFHLDEGVDLSNHRKLVEKASELIRNRTDLVELMGDHEEEKNDGGKPLKHSPTKRAVKSNERIPGSLLQSRRARGNKHARPPTIKTVRPEVVYSEPFNLDNMMQGVSLAIVCGLVSLDWKTLGTSKKNEDRPEQGSQLDGLHPYVETSTLKWARVKDMTIDYMNPANQNCRKYILLRDIGQGKNARVYLSVGEDGKACAMKFYLDKVDSEKDFSPDERGKKRVEHFEETRRKVRVEVQRWNTLQKDYKDYVHLLKLNKQNVLIMPVFAPLPSEDRERLLPAVERKLLEFFNNGYVYDEVRWQHIGCRHVDISGEAKKTE